MSDTECIQALKKGNARALESLIHKYQEGLKGIVQFYTKDKDLAVELVADVFIYLWLNRKKIQSPENVKAYLFKAAKNQAWQYLRKKKLPTQPLDALPQFDVPSEETSDQNLMKKESEEKIQSDLAFLPQQQRLVFSLHRFEGFSYQEIAEMLELSVHTVRNHMVQALKQLKEKFS